MTEESTFLVIEIWLDSSRLDEFKAYRIKLLDLLEKYSSEYIYHGHPFAWALNTRDGDFPTGIEIWRFKSKKLAKQALAAIEKSGLLHEGNMIVDRARCYLARYASNSSYK